MPGREKKISTERMYFKKQIAEIVGMDYVGRSLDTVLHSYRQHMVEGEHYVKINDRTIGYTQRGLTLIRKLWKKAEGNRNTYAPKNPHRGKRVSK